MARLSSYVESLVLGLKDPKTVEASRQGLRSLDVVAAYHLVQTTKSLIITKQLFLLPTFLVIFIVRILRGSAGFDYYLFAWALAIASTALTIKLWLVQRETLVYWLACNELQDIESVNFRLESIQFFLPPQPFESSQSVLFWEGITRSLEANATSTFLLSEKAYVALLTASSKIIRQQNRARWQEALVMAIPDSLGAPPLGRV